VNRNLTARSLGLSARIRGIKPAHAATVVAIIVAFYAFWSWWVSPEHRIAQFVSAVNDRRASVPTELFEPSNGSWQTFGG